MRVSAFEPIPLKLFAKCSLSVVGFTDILPLVSFCVSLLLNIAGRTKYTTTSSFSAGEAQEHRSLIFTGLKLEVQVMH